MNNFKIKKILLKRQGVNDKERPWQRSPAKISTVLLVSVNVRKNSNNNKYFPFLQRFGLKPDLLKNFGDMERWIPNKKKLIYESPDLGINVFATKKEVLTIRRYHSNVHKVN